ncbi:MAG: hypothetical protein KA146_03415, partial [Leptospiraceae bacterium]|nr:hypothetical protein [Leptospiraceae bacterium]
MNSTENNEQLMYRDQIAQLTEDLLLGPLYGDNEVIEENPLRFYSTGILYPPFFGVINDANFNVSESEGLQGEDEAPTYAGPRPGHYKSSIGITGAIKLSENINLRIQISFDQYIKSNADNQNYTLHKESFEFILNKQDIDKNLTSFESLNGKLVEWNYINNKMNANLKVSYLIRDDLNRRDMKLISIRLENQSENPEGSKKVNKDKVLSLIIFRPKIKLISNNGFEHLRKAVKSFNQENTFEFLFRNRKNYSSGVNISTKSDPDSNSIETEYVPKSNQLVLETDSKSEEFNDLLSAKELINSQNLSASLSIIVNKYEHWISSNFDSLNDIEATRIRERCTESLSRIKNGINALENKEVREIWLDSIKALATQYKWNNKNKNDFRFRLFQLAFFLMLLPDLINDNINENKFREIIDLLWIPTGGGKTEAYLAVSGFIILWNRKKKRNGVSVLTRYTLRLLTSQQFQRSASMIMALEMVRRQKVGVYGDKPISIGMLVGGDSTPNDMPEYKKKLSEWRLTNINPFPVEYCPVCLERLENKEWDSIDKQYSKNSYLFDVPIGLKDRKEPGMKCININCESHDKSKQDNFLPIYFIDESIFNYQPDFLLATVDKLAQIPFKKKEYIEMFNPPPSLILQDELHLINSSLGTVFANYESGIH